MQLYFYVCVMNNMGSGASLDPIGHCAFHVRMDGQTPTCPMATNH